MSSDSVLMVRFSCFPVSGGEAMSTDIEVQLQNLIDQAIKETNSQKLGELVEEIYRLLDARKKEAKQ
jgi:hypothetical protein